MLIIAHRANVSGPEPARENSLERTAECIARGWSVETDIRRAPDGRFYVSHDAAPWSAENNAVAFSALWRRSRALVALNIKELGDEVALIDFLREQRLLQHVFLFDMELLESTPGITASRFRALDDHVVLGARVSDRNEPIDRALGIACADIVWLDEFDHLWATAADVRAIQLAGRAVFGVSPELHGATPDVMRARWFDFIEWGVDGICTDAPEELAVLLDQVRGERTGRAA